MMNRKSAKMSVEASNGAEIGDRRLDKTGARSRDWIRAWLIGAAMTCAGMPSAQAWPYGDDAEADSGEVAAPAFCEGIPRQSVGRLSLPGAIKMALCHNPSVVKARRDVRSARLNYDAEDAKYASEVEFTVNESYQFGDTSQIENVVNVDPANPTSIRSNSERTYMSLRWTAPWWYKSEFKYEAAKSRLGIQLAEARLNRTEQDVMFSVYKAYLAALVQKHKLDIETRKLEAISDQSKTQQRNFELGRASEVGVVIEEGNLLNQQLTAGDTREAMDTKMNELLGWLDIKNATGVELDDYPLEPGKSDVHAYDIDRALQFQTQEVNIQIVQQAVEIDKHEDVWKPTVSTWAGYSPYIKSVGTSQSREINDLVTVGVEVQVELPNFEARDAAVKVASHDKTMLDEQLRGAIDDTRSQSRQFQNKLTKLTEQIELLDKLRKVQERRLEAGRKSVELGTMNPMEYRNLESNLDATQTQRLDKLFDYLVAEAELKHLHGIDVLANIR
ncbi:TolC family protein [Methylomonas sp. UP202]|nr:TolC family protein [Methylomonas sp. UP202]WGS85296.1 TolC family protein [Methylomonas sp. UP202]